MLGLIRKQVRPVFHCSCCALHFSYAMSMICQSNENKMWWWWWEATLTFRCSNTNAKLHVQVDEGWTKYFTKVSKKSWLNLLLTVKSHSYVLFMFKTKSRSESLWNICLATSFGNNPASTAMDEYGVNTCVQPYNAPAIHRTITGKQGRTKMLKAKVAPNSESIYEFCNFLKPSPKTLVHTCER